MNEHESDQTEPQADTESTSAPQTPAPGPESTGSPPSAESTTAESATGESATADTQPPAGAGPASPPPEVPSVPVGPVGRPPSGLRWGIALLVAAITIGIAAGALFLVSSGSQAVSPLARYVPTGSVFYFEARTELPGDQQQHLADVLGRFPGFKDQANLESKIDEALDQLMTRASNGAITYSTDIKPWFGGDVAFAAPGLSPDPTHPEPRVLVIASVKEATKAREWLAKVSPTGAALPTEEYGGVTLTHLDPRGQTGFGYGVTDQAILLGDLVSLKAAIDTKGASGFPDQPAFKDARAAVSGDVIGFGFYDLGQVLTLTEEFYQGSIPCFTEEMRSRFPAWAALTLRAESDAIVSEMVAPSSLLSLQAGAESTPKKSVLVPHLPASTLVAFEVHDLGAAIKTGLSCYKQADQFRDVAGQIEQGLGILGGVDAALSWIGDASIAVARDGSGVSGGLIVEAKDPALAERPLVQLRNLVSLGGGTVRDEPYADGIITVVDFGDLGSLLEATGQAEQIPFPVEARLELAFTVQRGIVVLAPGDGFIKAVLDAQDGTSLADEAGYGDVLGRAGFINFGQLYWNLAATFDLAEGLLPDAARETYIKDIKPYVAPLDAVGVGGALSGDKAENRFILKFR